MKKKRKECPYFIMVVQTSLIFACVHLIIGNAGVIKTDNAESIEVVHGISEEITPITVSGDQTASVSGNMPENKKDVSGNTGDVSGNGHRDISGNGVPKEIPWDESGKKADVSYLDDVLFIGDSRTSTLQQYAGWDNAAFYVKNGLTIWNVLEAKIAECEGELVTVEEALQKEKFGKIYIMLGINELGRGTPDTFAEEFGRVVRRIKELQPDAVIVMEAIMHVTETKDAEETYINNAEINARNEKLKELADSEGVYWLDVNPVTDEGEKGSLVEEYSFDGVHLKVKYIDVWKDFILENPFPTVY
ncbi:MAG: hypothetical protein K2K54_09140 [Lachnospiraceae bacterium]|nr:hypothetical protein [Lachnospiraceae bacterium]